MTLIEELLRLAAESHASDLHLVTDRPPVLRVNGVLNTCEVVPPLDAGAMASILEAVAPPERVAAFHRDKDMDIAYEQPGLVRCRVNACYQRGALSLSVRLLPGTIPSLEELGMPPVCRDLAEKGSGLVLVTGPTGSGKSTTLAAMVDYINQRASRRIVTIEDPIEFVHACHTCHIIQREVGSDTSSFASALRSALRQDPDVIQVGELRDLETISAALTAAETGHLVLSTLHTATAARTMNRIVDVFPPTQQQQIRMQLSMVLEGIISQLLLPRADGRGRVAAVEVMLGTPAIRNLIRQGKSHEIRSYMEMGGQSGMQTMAQAFKALTERLLITEEESQLVPD